MNQDLLRRHKSHSERISQLTQVQHLTLTRTNALLRTLQTHPHSLPSDAESRWFKELSRVNTYLNRTFAPDVHGKLAEARRYADLARGRGETEEEGKGVDWRVLEAVEEMYYPFWGRGLI
jgi:hypothetical protein